MTLKEFYNTSFHSKMKVKYEGNIHKIAGVDFEDKMICFCENNEKGEPILELTIWAKYFECEIYNL